MEEKFISDPHSIAAGISKGDNSKEFNEGFSRFLKESSENNDNLAIQPDRIIEELKKLWRYSPGEEVPWKGYNEDRAFVQKKSIDRYFGIMIGELTGDIFIGELQTVHNSWGIKNGVTFKKNENGEVIKKYVKDGEYQSKFSQKCSEFCNLFTKCCHSDHHKI